MRQDVMETERIDEIRMDDDDSVVKYTYVQCLEMDVVQLLVQDWSMK